MKKHVSRAYESPMCAYAHERFKSSAAFLTKQQKIVLKSVQVQSES